MSLVHFKYGLFFFILVVSVTSKELINYYRIQYVSRSSLNVDDKKSLTLVDLRGSDVRFVESTSFEGMINLQSLLLLNNKITCLPENVFDDLRNLEYLRLDTNEISLIKRNLFSNLRKLSTLDLSHNLILKLEPDTFDNTALKSLHLQYNRLTDIPAGLFSALSNLNHLDISNNNIYQMNRNAFPTNIQTLHVFANNLRYIEEHYFNSVKSSCLDKNPYVCDCQMKAMYNKWKSTYAGQCWVPDCFAPKSLRNIRWDKLTAEDFKCAEYNVYYEENEIVANIGQSITLKCYILGYVNIPDIILTYQDGTDVVKHLQNNRRYFNVEYIWNPLNITGVLYKLTINNVIKLDSNIYRCGVRNVNDAQIRVIVEDNTKPIYNCNQ